jgi:hypothetical protein
MDLKLEHSGIGAETKLTEYVHISISISTTYKDTNMF